MEDMRWDKLELSVPFVFYGKLVDFNSLVVQDSEVNGLAVTLETRHDAVVCLETVAVVP